MAPCGWEVIGCDDCEALNNLDPLVREAVEARAVARLWEWTNRRFGPCPVTYRPPHLGCRNPKRCVCQDVSEVLLPGPIFEPIEILIDGEDLDLFRVRVDNYNRLVRIDGGRFPTRQNMGASALELGTWQITYLKGEEVPPGGELVAGTLACEFAKAMCGSEECRLPKRVSSITRQGITLAMLDNFDKLSVGGTGIWEIDDWITTYTTNLRTGPWQRGQVSSPDLPMERITTWEYDIDS